MIPVELNIENFLSYRSATVDFTNFSYATIVGPNGVGKSSLLDAITFALFGRGRGVGAGGKDLDKLVRSGEDSCRVTLVFEVEGKKYRVSRERGKTQKVRLSILEGGEPRAIGGDNVREVDAAIEGVLKLDYESFTASAFLEQGDADRFMSMNPAERKRVFRRLLNLGVYDRLHERARDALKQLGAKIDQIDSKLQEARQLPEELGSAKTELAALEVRLSELGRDAEEATQQRDSARERVVALDAVEQQIVDARERITANQNLVEHTKLELQRATERLAGYEELIADADTIRARHADWNRLTRDLKNARQDAGAAAQLRDQAKDLLHAAQRESARVESEIKAMRDQAAKARHNAAELEGRIDLTELEKVAATVPTLNAKQAAVESERVDILGEYKLSQGRLNGLNADAERLRGVLEEFSALGGTCDKCGSELTPEHRRTHEEEIRKQLSGVEKSISETELQIARLLEAGSAKRSEVDALAKQVADASEAESALAAARVKIDEARRLNAEAAELETRATTLETDVLPGAGSEARARADALLEEAAGKANEKLISELEAMLEKLNDASSRLSLLETAERGVTGEREAVARCQSTLAGLENSTKKEHETIARAEVELLGSEKLRTALTEANDRFEKAQQLWGAARQEQGRLETRIGELETALARAEELRGENAELLRQRGLYSVLEKAFSNSGGIPDQIIKNALVDLKQFTNEIVARVASDFDVDFPTEVANKSGAVKDTLDVVVRNDFHTRPFENLSGGEQFRIAIAVRLALSRLLVERSNAELGTLVIDEGFGSQDPEGRTHLVNAIHAEKGRFAKVLLITHIDELKDIFPVQLLVEKTQVGGSKVQVIGA